MHRHAGRAAALGFAVLLAAAVSLPAVWWEPLHVDEAITLEYAPESPPAVLRDVFVERGGAPIFFLLEHVSLQWPGGLAGLRLPSFVFFLAAVALSAPVARQLGDRTAAILLPPLLAVAPLAVRLATFARMYALFLAGVLLAVWLLLRAVERRDRGAWILAGVVAGTLVYVHPIAPLYVGLALATAYLRSGLQLRAFLRNARPGLLALALVSAPYLYALAVLGRRYGVGSPESSLATSSSDRSVPAESLAALTHDAWAAAAFLLALALWGLIATVRSDRRTGIALALWIVVPIAFFSLVPSETNFFARYLLPALPFFLLLVALGCLAAGGLARRPLPVAIGLITAIVVWGAVEAGSRLEHLHALRLGNAVDTIAGVEDPVLFSSAGAAVAGRPALLLDAYGALELPAATLVEELPAADPGHVADIEKRGIAATRDFVAGPPRPGRGVWILSGSPRQVDRATRRLADEPDLEARRISPALLLVHSAEPLPPRRLVEQAIAVRKAWLGPNGRERWSQTLMDIEREALGGIP